MNSSEWKNYPKPGAVFPRVAECPDCHGTGLRIRPQWAREPAVKSQWGRMIRSSDFYMECVRCLGYGKCIPPEWLTG